MGGACSSKAKTLSATWGWFLSVVLCCMSSLLSPIQGAFREQWRLMLSPAASHFDWRTERNPRCQ
jgi:hypothetical protein